MVADIVFVYVMCWCAGSDGRYGMYVYMYVCVPYVAYICCLMNYELIYMYVVR